MRSLGGEEIEVCFARAKKASSLRWGILGVWVGLDLPRLAVPWERDAGVGVQGGLASPMDGQFSSSELKSRWGDLEMSSALRADLGVAVVMARALLVVCMIDVG